MGRTKKIRLEDLKQTNGNSESNKTVKEVVAQERVMPEIKSEVIAKEQNPEDKAYVAHGALSPAQTNNINALLKKFRRSPYDKFETTTEYSKAINEMSLGELHAHSIEVQVIPTSDKEKLIKNLENAFGVYINKNVAKIFPPSNLTVKGAAEIERIIAAKLSKKS